MRADEVLSLDERDLLAEALEKIQEEVRWKPDKDLIHLDKRRKLKHLPQTASISDYEKLIHEIVRNKLNILYLYEFGRTHYYAARGVADDIDDYIARRGFVFLGFIEEVLKWTKKVKK